MTTRIKLRRDTAANWLDANPILAAGEPGLETDTGKVKYGDGETAYADLPHAGGDTLTDDGSVVVTAGNTAHWIATQRRDGYNTEPRGLRYDSEGNLYALTRSNEGQDGIAIITKYTAAGAVAWQKSFSQVYPVTLAVDSSDRAYITVSSDPVITVIKFSTTGDILWQKNYDIGPIPSYSSFIEEKSTTTLALVATLADGGGPPLAVLAMEISSTDGSVLLKKTLALESPQITVVNGIDVDGDENVFITGHYYDSEPDLDKMFIEKLDQNFNRVWSKTLDSPEGYDMYGGDCASDAQGNVYAVGSFYVDVVNQGNGTTDKSAAILTKLNSGGVVQWTRRIGPGPCGSFVVGLTATDVGDVYLSSTTYANKTDGGFLEAPEFIQESYRSSKLIVARYNTLGAVIWQRYVDVVNLNEESSDFDRGQAVAVFGNKFAVDGYGYSTNNAGGVESSSTADDERDYFVAQLPTDGTELTIDNLSFTESRVPGRFVTYETINSSLILANYSETILAEDAELTADTEARIANNIVKSETYSYTFGADGTLTIPNDGDVKLTQSQVGYLMAIGTSLNNNDAINGRASAVDSQGYLYVGGEEEDDDQPFVMKISPTGDRMWGVIIQEDDNSDNGRVNALSINPNTGNLMVLAEIYGNYTYTILVTLDQDTGRILSHQKFSDTSDDVRLLDMAWTSTGTYVLGGEKNGDFSAEIPVTPQTGSTTGTIRVLRSALPAAPSTNWQIGGTGIDPFETIAYVERYTGLTGTVRQGSGATFDIIDNGNGSYSAGIVSGGTNYLSGHKIKILGTDLGGATPANDITITVQAVDGSGAITGVGNTGTAASPDAPDSITYTGLSGTNIDTGSGFTLTFEPARDSNNYSNYWSQNVSAGGSNYVENDIVVIPGTSLGGTSPTNDLTVRVSVSGGAVQYPHEFTGTGQSTTWKIDTTTQVDFGGTGSWSLTYPTSMEGLVVTPTWQRTFNTGTDVDDTIYSVAVDSSDNVIAVGRGYGELNTGNFRDLALVYKFNSTGTLQWVRQLNETGDHCWAQSVITIGTDIYVAHDSNDDGDTVITKLDSTGTVKWQRRTSGGDDACIARTANGNLMVVVEEYHNDFDDDAIKVFQLTASGETVYKRWLSATTNDDTRLATPRGLCVDNHSFYIGSYFDTDNYQSGLAVRLPLDGSGTGEYGSFSYQDVNNETGNWNDTGIADVNYTINTIDTSNGYTGAPEVAPTVNTGTAVTTGTGTFYVDSWYPDLTIETVHDTDGGSIVFADGSKQTTSATDIPQRRYFGQRYMLGLKDRGHHILCDTSNDNIIIPYNSRVPFPIGSVITIVNTNNSSIGISKEGGSISVMLAGDGFNDFYLLQDYGVATLLKIGPEEWVISGNVNPD